MSNTGANFISGPCGEDWNLVTARCHLTGVALRSYSTGSLPSLHSDLYVFFQDMLVGQVPQLEIQHTVTWFLALVDAAALRGGDTPPSLRSLDLRRIHKQVLAAREAGGYYERSHTLDGPPVIGETADT